MPLPPSLRYASRRAAVLALALLVAASALPDGVQAQQSGKRTYYRVHVFEKEAVCLYEIEEHENQDLFLIEPYGVVDFHATGTNARVEVQQSSGGARGTAGDQELKLKADGPPRSLRARGPRRESTEHKVYIRCCEGTSLGRCSDSREARPTTVRTGMHEGSHNGRVQTAAPAPRGPNALERLMWPGRDAFWPLPAGGPVMKVEED